MFIMIFSLTLRVSQLQEKIKELAHHIALVDKDQTNSKE